MSHGGSALELRGIDKHFGAVSALEGASICVRKGSLHMLLGENGAGKSTLVHIAVGHLQADAGTIELDGQPVRWRSRAEALAAGLSAVHQHFSLVPAMTVAENVALAERRMSTSYSAVAAAEKVRRIARAAGLSVDPSAIVGDLPVAAQQRVEIIKAIAHDAPVLVLDEPTAVLSPLQAADLFRWLRLFVDRGRTVVVITHRIREAMQHGDAITVLRHGRTTLAAPISDVSEQTVLAAILGESSGFGPLAARSPQPKRPRSAPLLTLRDASVTADDGTPRLTATSLSIVGGEIVGVAGVDGAGQHELLRLLSGRLAPSSGSIEGPDSIGFVPEDRLRDAIIPELSITENMALHGAGARRGVMRWRDLSSATRSAMTAFDVRGADESMPVGTLSGGNQQKFVLARELANSPTALVAENPTRGLDVRATHEILDRLRAARQAGAAVVVYSADIEELLSIADRIVVCFAGTVRETTLDLDVIGRALVGAQ